MPDKSQYGILSNIGIKAALERTMHKDYRVLHFTECAMYVLYCTVINKSVIFSGNFLRLPVS